MMAHNWHELMFPVAEGDDIPVSLKWRGPPYFGPYRHQNGRPGICVPLNTTAAVESTFRINDAENFFPLSVQHLLECYPQDYRKLNWMAPIIYQQGMFKEHHYPNQFQVTNDRGECRMPDLQEKKEVYLDSFFIQSNMDPSDIIRNLLEGPVVAKCIMRLGYNMYRGRVLTDAPVKRDGSRMEPNHAVMVTGYKLDSDIPHFIALNSYGLDWGDQGRCRISMLNNALGLSDRVAVPRYNAEVCALRNSMLDEYDDSYPENYREEIYDI